MLPTKNRIFQLYNLCQFQNNFGDGVFIVFYRRICIHLTHGTCFACCLFFYFFSVFILNDLNEIILDCCWTHKFTKSTESHTICKWFFLLAYFVCKQLIEMENLLILISLFSGIFVTEWDFWPYRPFSASICYWIGALPIFFFYFN